MGAITNILLLGLCIIHFSINAQHDIPENKKWQDPTYIRSFRDQPHLTFEFARRGQTIQILNPKDEKSIISYSPNSLLNFIGSIDYRWLSLSLGIFKIRAHPNNGNTRQLSLRASFNGKRIWNTNFLQIYKGFYLQNPNQIDPSGELAESSLRVRPDISSITLFSNLAYCFSPERFSYRAALWQLDRQEKSAGSFVVGASYRLNIMISDSTIGMIPKKVQQDFGSGRSLVSERLSNLTFQGGYIHTFVIRKYWFITVYLLPGISTQRGTYLAEDGLVRKYDNRLVAANEFRFIAGYNQDNWFTGISTHTLSFSGNRKTEIWVDNNYSSFRVFVGFRFRKPEPKRYFFRKLFDS